MGRPPLLFNTIICRNCGAIIALLPPGALVYDTKLRCVHCDAIRTTRASDESARARGKALTSTIG